MIARANQKPKKNNIIKWAVFAGRWRGIPPHCGGHEGDGYQRRGYDLHLEGHFGHTFVWQHGLQAGEEL